MGDVESHLQIQYKSSAGLSTYNTMLCVSAEMLCHSFLPLYYGSVSEPPVIELKETVLNDTSTPAEVTETPNNAPDEELAPPKPPLPGLKVPEHWYENV